MLLRFILGGALLLPLPATAGAASSLELLKRDFGDALLTGSSGELKYCAGDVCEIYRSKGDGELLATYAYLHLFHESKIEELGKTKGEKKPWREVAREEPEVRRGAEELCTGKLKTSDCVLDGLAAKLEVEQCTAYYYDKGVYCETCNGKTKCRNLLIKTKAARGTGGGGGFSSGRRCGG